MKSETRCERQGQVEIGIISHEGREFAALGASVCGRHITAYTKVLRGDVYLTSWCGKTMLWCRCEIVEKWREGVMVLVFGLTGGRFIVGYALGDGMLFRGELMEGTREDARYAAKQEAEHWSRIDDEDDEAFQAELRAELEGE